MGAHVHSPCLPSQHPADWLCLERSLRPVAVPNPFPFSTLFCPSFVETRPPLPGTAALMSTAPGGSPSVAARLGVESGCSEPPRALTHRGPRAGRCASCSAGCWGRRPGSRGSGSRRPGCSASPRTSLPEGAQVTCEFLPEDYDFSKHRFPRARKSLSSPCDSQS